MCAAMCLGFAVLDAAYIWAAGLLGYPDALRQYPEVAALVVAANMSIPMAAWMRYRGMSWRPIGEMSAAMFVEAVVLIGAYWLGLIAGRDVFLWEHGLMMPFMIAPMLFRLELYTGHAAHGSHAEHDHIAHDERRAA
jgi:hypothetical protein